MSSIDQRVEQIAQEVSDRLDAKLEARLEAVRQDLYNAVRAITGDAAILVAEANVKGVLEPALQRGLAPAIAAMQAKLDPKAVADALLAPDETDEGRVAYQLPITYGNRLQNYVTYALRGLLTNEDFLREWVAALDRATAPEAP